jgi:DNA-binding response OmpR family regulator
VYLIREAILATRIRAELHVVDDGDKAVQFFDRIDRTEGAPCPALVILDINLPKRPGGEVLRHMRKSRKCCNAPVLVVSTSDSVQDREEMAGLGANAYFHKPSDYDGFMKLADIIRPLLS